MEEEGLLAETEDLMARMKAPGNLVPVLSCHFSEIRSKKYGMAQYRTNYLINEIEKFKIRNLTWFSVASAIRCCSIKAKRSLSRRLAAAASVKRSPWTVS